MLDSRLLTLALGGATAWLLRDLLKLLAQDRLSQRRVVRFRRYSLGGTVVSGAYEVFSETTDPLLDVSVMLPGDRQGKAFCLQGYRGVQQAEGKEARAEELEELARNLDDGLGTVLLCRADSVLCGYLWYIESNKCPFGPGVYACEESTYIWVHTVYTAPQMRRQGVARALYRHLDEHVRRHPGTSGTQDIWLDVYNNNPASQQLHESLGFEPVTQIYRKKLIPL